MSSSSSLKLSLRWLEVFKSETMQSIKHKKQKKQGRNDEADNLTKSCVHINYHACLQELPLQYIIQVHRNFFFFFFFFGGGGGRFAVGSLFCVETQYMT